MFGNEYFGGTDSTTKGKQIWELAKANNKKPFQSSKRKVKSYRRLPLV